MSPGSKANIKRGKYFGWHIRTIQIVNPFTKEKIDEYELNENGQIIEPRPKSKRYPKRRLPKPMTAGEESLSISQSSSSDISETLSPVFTTDQSDNFYPVLNDEFMTLFPAIDFCGDECPGDDQFFLDTDVLE